MLLHSMFARQSHGGIANCPCCQRQGLLLGRQYIQVTNILTHTHTYIYIERSTLCVCVCVWYVNTEDCKHLCAWKDPNNVGKGTFTAKWLLTLVHFASGAFAVHGRQWLDHLVCDHDCMCSQYPGTWASTCMAHIERRMTTSSSGSSLGHQVSSLVNANRPGILRTARISYSVTHDVDLACDGAVPSLHYPERLAGS